MTLIDVAVERDRAFVESGAYVGQTPLAKLRPFVVTCPDPCIDHAYLQDWEAWATHELAEAQSAEALLMGRRSDEYFGRRSPSQSGELVDRLNSLPKYIVSSTLEDPIWTNATVLKGEVVSEVPKLKQQTGRNHRARQPPAHARRPVVMSSQMTRPQAGVTNRKPLILVSLLLAAFDPTQGWKIGSDPYDDPTQGQKIGSHPYEDPTRGRVGHLGDDASGGALCRSDS